MNIEAQQEKKEQESKLGVCVQVTKDSNLLVSLVRDTSVEELTNLLSFELSYSLATKEYQIRYQLAKLEGSIVESSLFQLAVEEKVLEGVGLDATTFQLVSDSDNELVQVRINSENCSITQYLLPDKTVEVPLEEDTIIGISIQAIDPIRKTYRSVLKKIAKKEWSMTR